jgi:soluble lytic murein transglycosylase-like protein
MAMPGALLALVLVGAPPLAQAPAVAVVAGPCATAYAPEIDAAVGDVSPVWNVPPSLVKAIIHRESAFKPRALSRAGAVGLMQVLPRNAARLGVQRTQLWEPGPNVLAGTRLLAVLLRHYRGDVVSALVAYNARPRKLLAPVPENGETAKYVAAVLRGWQQVERCPTSPETVTPLPRGPG